MGVVLVQQRLGKITYIKAVVEMGNRVRTTVQRAVVGKGSCLRNFSRALTTFEVGRTDRRRQKRTIKSVVKKKTSTCIRKSSGFDMFIKRSYAPQPGLKFIDERRRLCHAWSVMSEVEKMPFLAEAEQKTNDVRETAASASAATFSSSTGPHRERAAMRAAMLKTTIGQMQNHGMWFGGFGLAGFDAAMKPEYVVKTGSNEEMRKRCENLFRYSNTPVPNPPGKLSNAPVCHIQHAGLCGSHDNTLKCGIASYNLYAVLQKKGLQKKLPLMVSFVMPGVPVGERGSESNPAWWSIGHIQGKAECVVILRCVLDVEAASGAAAAAVAAAGPHSWVGNKIVLEKSRRKAFFQTSNREFDRIIRSSRMPPVSVTCTVWEARPDLTVGHWQKTLVSASFTEELSFVSKLKVPRKKKAAAAPVILPFGFVMNPEVAKKRRSITSS